MPAAVIFELVLMAPPTPRPPLTTSAPFVADVDACVLVRVMTLGEVTVPVPEAVSVTFWLVPPAVMPMAPGPVMVLKLLLPPLPRAVHVPPLEYSRLLFVVLKRSIPSVGEAGCCAVVPAGKRMASVLPDKSNETVGDEVPIPTFPFGSTRMRSTEALVVPLGRVANIKAAAPVVSDQFSVATAATFAAVDEKKLVAPYPPKLYCPIIFPLRTELGDDEVPLA